MSKVDSVTRTIAPSTFPKFKQEMTDMLDEMSVVYETAPAHTHAKGLAEILIKYGCA